LGGGGRDDGDDGGGITGSGKSGNYEMINERNER